MLHSGEFALEDIDFVLKMPYPESMVNEDIISNQNDLLNLANNMVDALADQFLDGDKEMFPPDIIRDIYMKFLPYDDKTVDRWIDILIKSKSTATEDFTEATRKNWKRLESKYGGKKEFKELLEAGIFDFKQEKLREGVIAGKHYFSSRNQDQSFPAELLRELDIRKLQNAEGRRMKLSEISEEMKYEFKYNDEHKNQRRKKKTKKQFIIKAKNSLQKMYKYIY